MKTKVDKFGRVLIPKKVREAAGLRPGDEVEIVPSGKGFEGKKVFPEPRLVRENGLVYITVDGFEDTVSHAVDDERERHTRHILGLGEGEDE